MKKIRLGVNIDHVATVRNARGENYPSPLRAATLAQKNGADSVTINLRNTGSIKKLKWDLDFADLQIKGRNSKGNIVTKYTIRKNGIELKEKGKSTRRGFVLHRSN